MFGVPGSNESKVLLQRFMEARDETTAESLLERLLTRHLTPLLQRFLRPKRLEEAEAEQVASRATEQMIVYLRRAREERRCDAVRHISAFVKMMAAQAFGELLDEKYPERRKLKQQLRYMLNHGDTLVSWRGRSGRTICGLSAWKEEGREPKPSRRAQRLHADPRAAAEDALPDVDPTQVRLAILVYRLLRWVEHPIDLEEMVHAVAQCKGIQDLCMRMQRVDCDEDDPSPDAYEDVVDPQTDVAHAVQQKETLRRLWAEIVRLTIKQRVSLLLGMRDPSGTSPLALFVYSCIVSLSEIAAALEMTWEQFAIVWNELPLEDRRIAEQLGITAENVRYQRHAARSRLTERLGSLSGC